MTSTEARPDLDLEAAFDLDVPCSECGSPATMRSFGHQVNDCGMGSHEGRRPPYFKCSKCFRNWLADVEYGLHRFGFVTCVHCRRTFTSAESFSDWRPF